MSVPAEKGKAGAHRKGGLVLMWAQRQKQCVSGQERAVCGGERSLGYSIASVQQSRGLGEFTVSECFRRDGMFYGIGTVFCFVISSTVVCDLFNFIQTAWLSGGLILLWSARKLARCVCLSVCVCVIGLTDSTATSRRKKPPFTAVYQCFSMHIYNVFYLLFVHVCLTSGSATTLIV